MVEVAMITGLFMRLLYSSTGTRSVSYTHLPMPVLDGNFEAFVTNLGKYNEGMLVGEWVKLPTTEEEMQKVFERIGIGKQDEFGQPLSLIHI